MFLVFFLLLFLTPSCDELRHGSAPAHLPFKGLGFLVERYIGRRRARFWMFSKLLTASLTSTRVCFSRPWLSYSPCCQVVNANYTGSNGCFRNALPKSLTYTRGRDSGPAAVSRLTPPPTCVICPKRVFRSWRTGTGVRGTGVVQP